MTVRIKRLDECLPAPQRETEGSAGYDLRSADTVTIQPGERELVGTGFAWEIPEGMVGQVRPRSGLAVRSGLHVMAGVIDSDYRGEVKVLLINLGVKPIHINRGDRMAQMVVTTFHGPDLIEVDDLVDSDRAGGFGSTGSN